jgi:glycosyltransferase involved in cell wall biosynthesis
VVNNNSSDKTAALVHACGITCIDEEKQGITVARNKGLSVARGTYILNADADTLYPSNWVDAMIRPLKDEGVALTYGNFSFLPIGSTGRVTYFVYEYITDLVRALKKKYREEAVNVYGFNSGFRRQQGLEVDGFNHPPGTNEDGWLALKLRDKGFGKLQAVRNAPVWTTDRRLQMDGGFWKAIKKRIKRNI